MDLDVCNAYFTTIDILRQLKNFSGAEQFALKFQELLPQIFANLQKNEKSDNMSSSLGWVLWYAVATKFEQELIEQRDSSVHYFDEKKGLS